MSQVQEVLSTLAVQYKELFASKFLISDVTKSNDIDQEVALEHGVHAQCLFLIRVNDKSALGMLSTVVGIVKNALGDSSVVILLENEERQ